MDEFSVDEAKTLLNIANCISGLANEALQKAYKKEELDKELIKQEIDKLTK